MINLRNYALCANYELPDYKIYCTMSSKMIYWLKYIVGQSGSMGTGWSS